MDDHDWNAGVDHAVREIETFKKELEEAKKRGWWLPTNSSSILDGLKERLLKTKVDDINKS